MKNAYLLTLLIFGMFFLVSCEEEETIEDLTSALTGQYIGQFENAANPLGMQGSISVLGIDETTLLCTQMSGLNFNPIELIVARIGETRIDSDDATSPRVSFCSTFAETDIVLAIDNGTTFLGILQ